MQGETHCIYPYNYVYHLYNYVYMHTYLYTYIHICMYTNTDVYIDIDIDGRSFFFFGYRPVFPNHLLRQDLLQDLGPSPQLRRRGLAFGNPPAKESAYRS